MESQPPVEEVEASSLMSVSELSESQTLSAQSIKFLITGGISAVIDLGLTWLFQIALDLLAPTEARTVGFVAGTLAAYILNRRWTFRAAPSKRRFVAVALTYGVTYMVNILLTRWGFAYFDDRLGWPSTVALVATFVVAQLVASLINFLVQRFLIFRNTHRKLEFVG